MVLSPRERTVLASSTHVYGNKHAFGGTSGLVSWNLNSVAKKEFEGNLDTVLSNLNDPWRSEILNYLSDRQCGSYRMQ